MSVYLIVGTNNNLIKKELDKIIKKDSEIISFDMINYSFKDVINEVSYISLFDEEKYIIVNNFALFDSKKDEKEEELLQKYLDNPNEKNNLIFICNKVDSRKKIVKRIKEEFKLINIVNIDYSNIYTLINNYLIENGYKMENNGVKYLVNLWGLNFDIITNELDKLFLYYDKSNLIKYDDLVKIVSKPVDDNSFHFVNAIINKNSDEIFKMMNDLVSLKTDFVSIIVLLAREFRYMYYVKVYLDEYKNKDYLIKELKMQDWQINKYYKEGLNFTKNEIFDYIKKLSEIDFKVKSGLMDSDICLNEILLDILT